MTPEELSRYAASLDYHLRMLDELRTQLVEVKEHIDQTKKSFENSMASELASLNLRVGYLSGELQKRGLPMANEDEMAYQIIKSQATSDDWPVAIDSQWICDTEEKAKERAATILSLVVSQSLKGKKFLDYGCGQGHTISEAMNRGALASYGFDVNLDENKVGALVTNNPEKIGENSYDIILVNDVLDHIVDVDPAEALKQMKVVLASSGRIYVRNHPWSSRHGGHLYEQCNKAFLHLVMDDVELMRMSGYKTECNLKVVTPLETYRHWFEKAGLDIVSENVVSTKVEDYFFNPSPVRDRILKHWNGDEVAARNNMKIDFVEFVLQLPSDISPADLI